MLDTRRLALDGLVEIRPAKFGDERGFFSQTWSAEEMAGAGFELGFVQDNHSYSAAGGGSVGGLHYDPAICIDWPVARGEVTLSPKDASAPLLADGPTGF